MDADRSNGGALSVRRVHPSDLPAIAKVHIAAFPDAAITSLGAETVRRYYEWQLDPVHDAIGLVAERDGLVVGFCFGGLFRGAMSGFLRKNWGFLLWAVASRPIRLLQRRFRGRVWKGARLLSRLSWREARRHLGAAEPGGAARPALAERYFGILAIATELRQWSAGIGRALMAAAEEEARGRGFERMCLTVHPTNDRAVRFYEALGWQRVNSGPSWSGVMERRFGIPDEAVSGGGGAVSQATLPSPSGR